jgi:ABC-type amino acid transport substrate-binding protein
MKKYIFYFFTVFLIIFITKKIVFKKDIKLNSIKSNEYIVVGTNSLFPPYEFIEDNKLVGFDIDLIEEISKKLNKKIIWKDMEFDSLILDLQSGQIDLIAAAMSPTIEREKKISFTKKYIEKDCFAVITRKKDIVNSIKDLVGKEVIVVDGYAEADYIEKQEGISSIRLSSSPDALLALINGKGFAHLSVLSVMKFFLKQQKNNDLNIFITNEYDSRAIGIAKNNSGLLIKINSILFEFEKDGTLDRLRKKWDIN